jgi:hypothetical protein
MWYRKWQSEHLYVEFARDPPIAGDNNSIRKRALPDLLDLVPHLPLAMSEWRVGTPYRTVEGWDGEEDKVSGTGCIELIFYLEEGT